jgi:hypothetical protein
MRKIDQKEAQQLIQSKQAGWYAVWANPPLPHPNQMVIEFSHNCYLVDKEFFEIEATDKVIIIGGVPKQVFSVRSYDPELTILLKTEIERFKTTRKTDVEVIPGYSTNDE